MDYAPTGFRVRIASSGSGLVYGEDPLPDFSLNETTGVLTYLDGVAGSPPVSDISLSANGELLMEVV